MPGLVGIISTNGNKIDLSLLGAMRDAIRHKEWYKIDNYVHPKATVGISRVHLGIINQDNQPYSARGGQVKIFLNGEIYNDSFAHVNPSEYIYCLYEKEGLNFAACLNGSFIIVIVDESKDRVLIANDRLATNPLFYFNDGRALYFGPEMKSLFLVASLERKLNPAAVADFMTNGAFTREHTLVEGLVKLRGATVLEVTPFRVTLYPYWKRTLAYDKDRGLEYYQEELACLLRQAVRRRLQTDKTYGILLSGGYDSRGILGCYLAEGKGRELHTITWGSKEDIPNSDAVIARKVARKLGADHTFYQRTAEEAIEDLRTIVLLGEGQTDEIASYAVFDQIREEQGIDILLRGDQSFGGEASFVYDEHTLFRKLGCMALEYIPVYQRVLQPRAHQLFCELDAETRHTVSSKCSLTNLRDRKEFFYTDVLIQYGLNPLNYIKTFALESFMPLLDHDLLDFVSTLPIRYRLDKILYRKTVTKMFPELFEEIAHKRNDIDWADSFRNSPELEHLVYRELVDEPSLLDEFIDKGGLKSELDAFFHPPAGRTSPGPLAKAKTDTLRLVTRSPAVRDLVHRSVYYYRKWRGKSRDLLPTEKLVLRLLILKVWGDVFLTWPVLNGNRPGDGAANWTDYQDLRSTFLRASAT